MSDSVRNHKDAPFRISNAEALEVLRQHEVTNEKKTKRFQHRNWIRHQVIEYLQVSPCMQLDASRREELKSILRQCKDSNKRKLDSDEPQQSENQDFEGGFGLSESDVLHILDFMPTEPVDMYLMVEGFHGMPPSKQEALIDLITSFKVKPSGKQKPVEDTSVAVPQEEPTEVVKTEIID